MTKPHLSVRQVTKQFASHRALDGVSLDVSKGEIVVIVGPSGCGKTTLLRLIAGLDEPDEGELWLAGRQVAGPGQTLVRPHERKIGFVFQDLALWPHLTVRQHVDFVLESIGTPRRERPSRARQALALVQVEALSLRYPHELSGGEQQRVALARAFVGNPELLLMDEPLSSLDSELRVTMRRELLRIQDASEVTVVYVTHDREDAAVLADSVIEMRAGRITGSSRKPEAEDRA